MGKKNVHRRVCKINPNNQNKQLCAAGSFRAILIFYVSSILVERYLIDGLLTLQGVMAPLELLHSVLLVFI